MSHPVVLVTGGSQGATILSDVVPDAMAMLPMHLRRRLQITQQCREADIERVRAKYAEHDIFFFPKCIYIQS